MGLTWLEICLSKPEDRVYESRCRKYIIYTYVPSVPNILSTLFISMRESQDFLSLPCMCLGDVD